jgi:hypothetical protein
LVRDFPAADEAQALAIAAGLSAAAVEGIGSNIVQTVKTDTFSASIAAGADATVTGFTASITPSVNTAKVLVIVQAVIGSDANAASNVILTRGGSAIFIGDAASARKRVTATTTRGQVSNGMGTITVVFLDSPTTDLAVTYGLDVHHSSGSAATVYLNRSADDLDSNTRSRGASSITLIEVKA